MPSMLAALLCLHTGSMTGTPRIMSCPYFVPFTSLTPMSRSSGAIWSRVLISVAEVSFHRSNETPNSRASRQSLFVGT